MFGCSEREFQRGDEIAWSADGDKIVRNEYNPATAYAFGNQLLNLNFLINWVNENVNVNANANWFVLADKVFGPHTASQEVYEVAAKPVVKAAMEGVNGMVLIEIRIFIDNQVAFVYSSSCGWLINVH